MPDDPDVFIRVDKLVKRLNEVEELVLREVNYVGGDSVSSIKFEEDRADESKDTECDLGSSPEQRGFAH